jgi:hypothetical protein
MYPLSGAGGKRLSPWPSKPRARRHKPLHSLIAVLAETTFHAGQAAPYPASPKECDRITETGHLLMGTPEVLTNVCL